MKYVVMEYHFLSRELCLAVNNDSVCGELKPGHKKNESQEGDKCIVSGGRYVISFPSPPATFAPPTAR